MQPIPSWSRNVGSNRDPDPSTPGAGHPRTESPQPSLLYLMGLLTHNDSRVRMHDTGTLESRVMTLQDRDHGVQWAASGTPGAM